MNNRLNVLAKRYFSTSCLRYLSKRLHSTNKIPCLSRLNAVTVIICCAYREVLALYRPVNSPLMAYLNCITATVPLGFWFFWECWYNTKLHLAASVLRQEGARAVTQPDRGTQKSSFATPCWAAKLLLGRIWGRACFCLFCYTSTRGLL